MRVPETPVLVASCTSCTSHENLRLAGDLVPDCGVIWCGSGSELMHSKVWISVVKMGFYWCFWGLAGVV